MTCLLPGLLYWSSPTIAAQSDYAQDIRFTRLLNNASQIGDGIGATSNIAQDHHGFIWIAGENGVIKYDGINTKHYIHDPTTPSLSSNYTRNILVDHSGVVWVGTELGLCYLDKSIDNFRCFTRTTSHTDGLSDNTIYALALAADNRLFIGTGDGLNILSADRTHFRHLFSRVEGEQAHPLETISSVMIDGDLLWIGTANAGFGVYNLQNQKLKRFPYIEDSNRSLSFPHVKHFLKDQQGRVWISTYGGGVNRLNDDGETFTVYRHDPDKASSIGGDVIWKGFEDSQNTIWFASDHGGLARYNERTDDFTNYKHDPYDPASLSSNQVRTIFEDYAGNLWAGTFPQGVNYINRNAQNIEHWTSRPGKTNSLSHSAILSLLEDRNGNIWIGTENGLNKFDPTTQKITHYLPQQGKRGRLQAGSILSLEEDRDGNLWVGTWSGGLHVLNKATDQFEHFPVDKNNPHALHENFIWSLLWDDQTATLLVGSEHNGMSLYDPQTGKFDHFTHSSNPRSISSNFVLNMITDNQHNIWIATTGGLDRFDRKTRQFTRYKRFLTTEKFDRTQLESVRFRSSMIDHDNRIWLGSQNNGIFIFDPRSRSTTIVDVQKGLPSNYVASMIQDSNNQVWVTTSNGVARIRPDDVTDISVFTHRDGLASNHYNRNATLLDSKGMIYLGGIDGTSRFNPQRIRNSQQHTPVRIHDFRVMNRSVQPGEQDSPLHQPIVDTKSLVLQHHHAMITFEYIALNFAAPDSFEYAYKLEGFDSDWNYVDTKRFATYTNLNHGEYTFSVKAKSDNSSWPDEATKIHIRVLPPPWLTWWAISLYVILILLLIFFLVRIQYKRLELISEKSLNAELIRLNRIKDAFLANTSHELRTPLNGIIGIAESVYEETKEKVGRDVLHKLNLIALSGKRLSGLINDILDYTKLGRNKLIIHPKNNNLYDVANDVFSLLKPLADEKDICLINHVRADLPAVFADENRLQQILLNLVGNGIKYSEHGHVKIIAYDQKTEIEVHVQDTGIGIRTEDINSIFEAFQQVEDKHRLNKGGTGLGLAVTKELVELHGGRIRVESHYTRGSDFIFTMPMAIDTTPNVYQADPPQNPSSSMSGTNDLLQAIERQGSHSGPTPICDPPPDAHRIHILIVDDDPVNRMVLHSMLQLHCYKVTEAKDGFEALEILQEQPIDVVVLDIMMPRMSGFDVCAEIRKCYPIHKLPVLFLTAKRVDDDVAHGFEVGGNEFLTKPVSKYEILPRIANHVRLLQIYRRLGRQANSLS